MNLPKVTRSHLSDVLIIEPKVFGDNRGFFSESFNAAAFERTTGVKATFVKDNHSKSERGVLRGMHYQLQQPQGKLIRVVRGEIYDVVVDIRNHPEEGSNPVRLPLVHIEVLLRTMERTVGSIGADIGKERLLRLDVLTDELVGLIEEHIGTKALGLDDLSIMKIPPVEISIIPNVRGLPDTTTSVTVHFLESTILGTIGIVVSHMPLSEHASFVSVVL